MDNFAIIYKILKAMDYDLDYDADYYCPAYKRAISADLCYDSLCCLSGEFKISSTKELLEIKDIDDARRVCKTCPYSKL